MINWIISSSILILAIIMLRYLCKGKISLRFQYALWLLAAVRLLIPVNFGTSFLSIENVTKELTEQPQIQNVIKLGEKTITITSYESAYQEVIQRYEEEGRFLSGVDAEEMKQEAYALMEEVSIAEMIEKVVFKIWRAGIILFILVFLITNFVFGIKIKKNRQQLDISYAKIPVYLSNMEETPCLFGLLSPAIYVTTAAAENPILLRHTVFHEMTHYYHKDLYWSAIRCVCLALHWYNPLVWWAAILSKQDAELACDEGTLRRLGEKERIEYGKTLIQLTCKKNQNLFRTATTMTSEKNKIKERIMLIARRPKTKLYALIFVLAMGLTVVSCTFTDAKKKEEEPDTFISEQSKDISEPILATEETDIPSQKKVLEMREQVLKGMTEEEIKRLKENIKVANLQMEQGYLNEDLFGKLEDKNHLYWNYFDKKGEIQIGWEIDEELSEQKKELCKEENLTEEAFYEKYGTPLMVYNRFDGNNFIELLEDMKTSIHNEKLRKDIQYLIDETKLAVETHEMEHVNNIYKILHDMDYFLLRYGIEDVGVYTQDDSIVSKYYGVLSVYAD